MSTDLTQSFNEALKTHNVPLTTSLTLQNIDEFLKEAYRINAHITQLNNYLQSIRKNYLSTAPPPRRSTNKSSPQEKHLSDKDRDAIDAETKGLLRQLNTSIKNLADAEQLRQNTELVKQRKKYGGKLGLMTSWASGGLVASTSAEEVGDKAKMNTINAHRESVLWYLRSRLKECSSFQTAMMEIRMTRAIEKNKSILSKTKAQPRSDYAAFQEITAPTSARGEREAQQEEQLSAEQIQIFEQENQDLIKHYQNTLDQVRIAEKSMYEISELHTQLVANLDTQSAHIEQLKADSELTLDNVGGGNKELKKATERKSTAKYVFYASCGLSFSLILWDFLI